MPVYKMTPTKANLIKAKNSLEFSKKGYELLDKKRTVLIREMMALIESANKIENEINIAFQEAYKKLQFANITMGSESVEEIAMSLEKEEGFDILFKSIMGVEIPYIKYEEEPFSTEYDFFRTNPTFDMAILSFIKIRYLIYKLAEIENSVYKLATEIEKTQKRANALEKIQIPKYTKEIKVIGEVLEEKEREDFFRLKRVKGKK